MDFNELLCIQVASKFSEIIEFFLNKKNVLKNFFMFFD